ncbi:unnamed protein product [Orchesella dallaii]|uniref:DOMON domain-containing protein n=1 Tax=Orchesella dallaii TaxID=48710 RepID=A0ABP1RF44_9HEXA
MGCGETWACTSEATWANSGCPFILKWSFIPSTEYMRFQLIGLRFNGPPGSCQPRSDGALLGYIGIGFSAHDSMGDNIAVIECSVTEETGGTLVKNVTFGRDGKNSNEYYYWDKVCCPN